MSSAQQSQGSPKVEPLARKYCIVCPLLCYQLFLVGVDLWTWRERAEGLS